MKEKEKEKEKRSEGLGEGEMMGLEGLGDLAVHTVLRKLPPEDIARVACVSSRLRASASEDSLWRALCSRDLRLASPLDPLANPLPSFKLTYQIWRQAFLMYPWSLVKRVKKCWDTINSWLTHNFPEAEATLCQGASEDEIHQLETALKLKLPLPTRILYRFQNGQQFAGQHLPNATLRTSLGLIGGYSFYNHIVNVYLLPLSQVLLETRQIVRHMGFSTSSKYIVLAASSTNSEKLFFLNCTNGQLYVGTRNLATDGEMIPCVPYDLINLAHGLKGDQQDAMLLWLEEHGHRLQNGIIKLHEEGNVRSISLFPEESPLCSTAVTNGVKVRASAVFIPELANLLDDDHKYIFSYSIRMSLQPQGCIINGMYFNSCQLHWRHWLIRANDVIVSEVNAEAVIGEYPLLYPGNKEFVYQSCSPLSTPSGSIEGSFTFVPGSLANPEGGPFEVIVARFPLQRPDYVF